MVFAVEPLKVVPANAPPLVAKVNAFTTEPALPLVFWFKVGISAATNALKLGVPAEPFGEANI